MNWHFSFFFWCKWFISFWLIALLCGCVYSRKANQLRRSRVRSIFRLPGLAQTNKMSWTLSLSLSLLYFWIKSRVVSTSEAKIYSVLHIFTFSMQFKCKCFELSDTHTHTFSLSVCALNRSHRLSHTSVCMLAWQVNFCCVVAFERIKLKSREKEKICLHTHTHTSEHPGSVGFVVNVTSGSNSESS